MALIHSFEETGNTLFKYRGQIPVLLFILAIPVIYFTDYTGIGLNEYRVYVVTCIVISFLGLLVRAYTIGTTPANTSGRNTKKQVAEALNSTGIYSTVRHPLYVGNYLMWIGIVAYTFNLWFVISVSLAYWLYYERIMFAEERFLEKKFGQGYLDWSKKIPAFIPNFKKFIKPEVRFSMKPVLRREYSGFFATVIGFVFVDILRESILMEELYVRDRYYYILAGAAFITLVLRSLKHYTNWLNEEGRS